MADIIYQKPSLSPTLVTQSEILNLPPILDGHDSPKVREKTEYFYRSVANLFDVWLQRSSSSNTQRSYKTSIMRFIEFQGIDWQNNSWELLQATIEDVRNFRNHLISEGQAPNTLNHRISSLSGFFSFLRETATEQRLPILVPNPAHKDFIKREVALPVNETQALSISQARKLLQLPQGNSLIAHRDRAIIAFYLYTGARLATGCRLKVHDFLNDLDDPKIKIQEKGKGASKRTIGLNQIASDILKEYLNTASIASGEIFKKQLHSHSKKLSNDGLSESAVYNILMKYLEQLPNAMVTVEHTNEDGEKIESLVCRYSPHSIRATTATLLLDAGVPMQAVQKLLGHAQITTTQTYNKQRLQSKDSASHKIPF